MKKQLLAAALCCVMLTGCGAGAEPTGSAEQAEDISTVLPVLPDPFSLGGPSSLKLAGGLSIAEACGLDYDAAEQEISFSGSGDAAWERLLNGELDAVIGYAPSDETAQKLEEQGIALQEIGTDALVFLAGGTTEPVSLTKDDVLAAYQGTSSTWKGYAAAAGTDSRQIFAELLGADGEGMTTSAGDDTLTAACPHTAGTLCYTTYLSLLQNGKPEQTAIAQIDGYLPGEDGYPLTKTIYAAAAAGQETNAPAVLFVNWLGTEEGSTWLRDALQTIGTEPVSMPDAS